MQSEYDLLNLRPAPVFVQPSEYGGDWLWGLPLFVSEGEPATTSTADTINMPEVATSTATARTTKIGRGIGTGKYPTEGAFIRAFWGAIEYEIQRTTRVPTLVKVAQILGFDQRHVRRLLPYSSYHDVRRMIEGCVNPGDLMSGFHRAKAFYCPVKVAHTKDAQQECAQWQSFDWTLAKRRLTG